VVVEVWLLLATIGGHEVYLDVFDIKDQCRVAALEHNFIERSLQIEGEPECRRFIRDKEDD
jgi:hypothetical protein